VSDDDLTYLHELKTTTTLAISVLSRLLLHRGIRLHKADGQLTE